jgi:hypothetical protein
MPDLLTSAQALEESAQTSRHLLVGNGFSMAQGGARFDYQTLLDRSGLPPGGEIRNVFQLLHTVDFEEVMKALEAAAVIENAYGDAARAGRFNADADALREALIHAVRQVHPGIQFDIPEVQRTNCAAFLRKFVTVFTLNYDLLAYWVILHGAQNQHSDGFGLEEAVAGFRTFSMGGNCSVYFLHGALHLFRDDQLNTQKRVVTNVTIIEDIAQTIRHLRKLPLFVAEGTTAQKMRKINSVSYLRHGYDRLQERDGSLCIYGHSAGEKDGHIYSAIGRSQINTIYCCVFRPADNFVEMQARLAPFSVRYPGIELKYVDGGTVDVWGGVP